MTSQVRSALVLQGGGALGAYELGAARALYKENHFSPDLIAGVSIGAITAVILARPARGLNRSKRLKYFGKKYRSLDCSSRRLCGDTRHSSATRTSLFRELTRQRWRRNGRPAKFPLLC